MQPEPMMGAWEATKLLRRMKLISRKEKQAVRRFLTRGKPVPKSDPICKTLEKVYLVQLKPGSWAVH